MAGESVRQRGAAIVLWQDSQDGQNRRTWSKAQVTLSRTQKGLG